MFNQTDATPSQVAAAAAAGVDTSFPPRKATASVDMRDLPKDPEFREAQRAQMRASVSQNYTDLAKGLALTPDETNAMFDLISKNLLDSMAGAMASNDGHPPDEAAMRAVYEGRQEQENNVRSLLGSDRYQKWREYQQTLPARQQVNQLRGALSSSGQSLNDEQVSSLVVSLSTEQKRSAQEQSLAARGMAGSLTRRTTSGAQKRAIAVCWPAHPPI